MIFRSKVLGQLCKCQEESVKIIINYQRKRACPLCTPLPMITHIFHSANISERRNESVNNSLAAPKMHRWQMQNCANKSTNKLDIRMATRAEHQGKCSHFRSISERSICVKNLFVYAYDGV